MELDLLEPLPFPATSIQALVGKKVRVYAFDTSWKEHRYSPAVIDRVVAEEDRLVIDAKIRESNYFGYTLTPVQQPTYALTPKGLYLSFALDEENVARRTLYLEFT